jgi:hypothetical protein
MHTEAHYYHRDDDDDREKFMGSSLKAITNN